MFAAQLNKSRIDVHHHFFPDTLRKAERNAQVGWRTPVENLPWTPQISLEAMDALGITTAILSLPADALHGEDHDAATKFNLHASDICRAFPGRFEFFACVSALSSAPVVLQQIAFALDDLKASGIALASSYGSGTDAKYLGDVVYNTIWEELDRRKAVVFIHGAQIPATTPFPHLFLGLPVTEVPKETFRAAAHLVVTGTKRLYPNVKIILAHLGGCTPFLASRIAVLSRHMGCPLSHEEILEDFKSFYYETALSADRTTLSAMQNFVEPDHILFGTDFPGTQAKLFQTQVLMYDKTLQQIGWQLPADHAPWAPEISLKAMDMLGITTAVLSLPECVPAEKAREINIHSSSIRDKFAGGFEFFATMPTLSDTKAVLGEIAYALDTLHAIGVALPSSFGHGTDAKYIGHDVCDPMWEELDRRGAIVFLHGGQPPHDAIPSCSPRTSNHRGRCPPRCDGQEAAHPNVKIILSHLGGSTPFLAPRVAVLSNYMGRDEILQDFKSFYYETALSGYETTLTAIQSFVEPDHLLFGSDFPAVTTEMAGWYAKNVEEFYAGDQMHLEALMSKNALRLMPSLKAY
ncbi:2-amino-3-carboxymuconate-6-semialdehyde decarboxylase, partial [Grifola frondosa]